MKLKGLHRMILFETILLLIDKTISLIGVLIIAYSSLKAVYLFCKGLMGESTNINRIRLELGYGIILGLEFIVAADIIESTVKPTFYDIGMLAALVLIRTFLSYFLNKELETVSPEKQETIQNIAK